MIHHFDVTHGYHRRAVVRLGEPDNNYLFQIMRLTPFSSSGVYGTYLKVPSGILSPTLMDIVQSCLKYNVGV